MTRNQILLGHRKSMLRENVKNGHLKEGGGVKGDYSLFVLKILYITRFSQKDLVGSVYLPIYITLKHN